MDVYKTLGRVIRKERKAQSLTQQQLGQFSGTGLNFISQLERGKSTVRFDKLLAVIEVLGLELQVRRGKGVISTSKNLS